MKEKKIKKLLIELAELKKAYAIETEKNNLVPHYAMKRDIEFNIKMSKITDKIHFLKFKK